jgi:hypothetical protein
MVGKQGFIVHTANAGIYNLFKKWIFGKAL